MFAGLKRLMKGESNVNIIGRSKVWALVSLGVIVLSGIGLFGRGMNFSLEFEGGTAFVVPSQRAVTVEEVESALTSSTSGRRTSSSRRPPAATVSSASAPSGSAIRRGWKPSRPNSPSLPA